MSEIKVNNIQGLEGTHGPVVSGITTMASSGAMSLPRGDTAYRGGRGRGIFGGGYGTPTFLTQIRLYRPLQLLEMHLILVIYHKYLREGGWISIIRLVVYLPVDR